MLDAALAAGLNLPHSCKSGHCSSCRARLMSGQIRYPNGPPLGLTAAEAAGGLRAAVSGASAYRTSAVEARLIANVAEVEIKTLPCRIARMTALAPDVMQVFLKLPSVETLRFQAGQYLDVLLEEGERRSFSIASPPHDSELIELHVRRVAGGGFTERCSRRCRPARCCGSKARSGSSCIATAPQPLIMIAGGTGFAPLKSMLRHMLERGVDAADSFLLGRATGGGSLRGGAGAGVGANASAAEVLRGAVGSSGAGRRTSPAGLGARGRAGGSSDSSQGFDVYVAGPPALVEAVRASFPAHGLSEDRLSFDSFDYAPDAQR